MYLNNNRGRCKIMWLLRDSQQSTQRDGNWLTSGSSAIELMQAAVQANIPAVEIGGGRFWEVVQLSGENPFRLIYKARKAVSECPGGARMDLQILLRGANGVGFNHIDRSVTEQLIRQHVTAGVTVFRTFDALNDIDNIHHFSPPSGAQMQGALAYTVDDPSTAEERNIYTVDYYVNFAHLLVRKGFQTLCIKDMAGQLEPGFAFDLIARLKKRFPDHPVTLHIHSSDENQSAETIERALEAGIDGIELALSPLEGGASHHSIETFMRHPRVDKLDECGVEALRQKLQHYFSNRQRVDVFIPASMRKRFCRAGIPGGAIPSIVSMLETQFKAELDNADIDRRMALLDRYLRFVSRVRRDAGMPPLVTPSADIVCRQAIFSFTANRTVDEPETLSQKQMYGNVTPDYVALVLGHFGFIHKYGDGVDAISKPDPDLIDYCSQRTFAGGETFVNIWAAEEVRHSSQLSRRTFNDFLAEVDAFISRLGDRLAKNIGRDVAQYIAENIVYRFASKEQIALFLAMPPKGKDSEFVWWQLVLRDFKEALNVNVSELLDRNEDIELLETLYGRQCFPEAWRSKSSDLHTLSSFMPTIIEYFNDLLSSTQKALHGCQQDIQGSKKIKWMYRSPIRLGRVRSLRKQARELKEKIEFCRSITLDTTLADNPQAGMILDNMIYPLIWQYIRPDGVS